MAMPTLDAHGRNRVSRGRSRSVKQAGHPGALAAKPAIPAVFELDGQQKSYGRGGKNVNRDHGTSRHECGAIAITRLDGDRAPVGSFRPTPFPSNAPCAHGTREQARQPTHVSHWPISLGQSYLNPPGESAKNAGRQCPLRGGRFTETQPTSSPSHSCSFHSIDETNFYAFGGQPMASSNVHVAPTGEETRDRWR